MSDLDLLAISECPARSQSFLTAEVVDEHVLLPVIFFRSILVHPTHTDLTAYIVQNQKNFRL